MALTRKFQKKQRRHFLARRERFRERAAINRPAA